MGQREEVQGRKTDVKDAEWICEISRHGLVKASFIPSREQRELGECKPTHLGKPNLLCLFSLSKTS